MRSFLCVILTFSLAFAPQMFQFSVYGEEQAPYESISSSENFVPGEVIVKLEEQQSNSSSGLSLKSTPDFLNIDLDCYIEESWNFSESETLSASASVDIATKAVADPGTADMLLIKSETLDTNELISELENQPNVAYVQPNYTYQICEQTNDPEFKNQWFLSNPGGPGKKLGFDVNINSVWSEGITGNEDYVVAVLDTGVDYNHEDLKDNMWSDTDGSHGYNFVRSSNDPMDDNSHGTHCAGIIGAKGNNNIGVSGVNQQTKLMALKVANSGGTIKDSNAISAYKYMIDKKESGVNIVAANDSWASPNYSRALLEAINIAGEKSILSICASGNEQTNNNISNCMPANFDSPYVISVGATSPKGARWLGSNFGDIAVDVMAPGENIYSTVPGNGYEYKTGTSMATPIISGCVALLNDYSNKKDKNWSMQEIKDRIIGGTNTSVPSLKSSSVSGGYFDLNEAISNPQPVLEGFELSDNVLTLNGLFLGHTNGLISIDGDTTNFTISSWKDDKIVIKLKTPLTGKHKFVVTNSTTNKSGQCSFNLKGDFEELNPMVITSDTQNNQYKTINSCSIIGKNNGIYAFGGKIKTSDLNNDSNYDYSNNSYDIYKYDISSETWSKQEASLPDRNLIIDPSNISLAADEDYIWVLMTVRSEKNSSSPSKVLYKYDPVNDKFINTEEKIIVDSNTKLQSKTSMTYMNGKIYIFNKTSSKLISVDTKTNQVENLNKSLPCQLSDQTQLQAVANKLILVGQDATNSKCQYYRTFVLDCSKDNCQWVEKSHTKNIKTINQQEKSFTSGVINSDQILFTGMYTTDSNDKGSWIYNISTDIWENADVALSLKKVSGLSGCSYNNYFYVLGIDNNSENLFKRMPLNDDTVTIKYKVNNEQFGSISTNKEDIALSTGEAVGCTAMPNPGYKLKSWELNGKVVSTDDTFVPPREDSSYKSCTYEAHFEDCWEEDEAGNWKYIDKDGTLKKGWLNDPVDDNWYYLDDNSGTMITGWFKDPSNGLWYYFDTNEGNMVTGWLKNNSDSKWYYFDADNGNMLIGWFEDPSDGAWYYFNDISDDDEVLGEMEVGLVFDEEDKAWYYLSEDTSNNEDNLGKMVTGKHVINGKNYTFNNDGKLISGL